MRKRAIRNAALWTVVVMFLLIGIIVFVSATGQTPKGESIIENPGALIGTVITGVGGLMAIILPAILKVEKNSEELKEQVKNDHKKADGTPLLLRDDLDDKHDVVLARLDSIDARFNLIGDNVENIEEGVRLAIQLGQANASDVRGMRRDMGRLTDDIRENTRETSEIRKLATGVIRTVSTLEGEVVGVKNAIVKYHPEEKP